MSFLDTPESGKNAPLESHPFCTAIIETCCQIAQELGQREVVAPTWESIGTYGRRRARTTRRTLLRNCKGAGRVYDMRPRGKAIRRGGHPAVQIAVDITSFRLAFRSDGILHQQTLRKCSNWWGFRSDRPGHVPKNVSTVIRDSRVRASRSATLPRGDRPL